MGQTSFQSLERALEHKFGQEHLLVQALTHSSLAHEFQLTEAAKTGQIGDGKIFISKLDRAVRVRTGETDSDAL